DVGAGGHRQGAGHADGEPRRHDGGRGTERGVEPAHGAHDLDEAVVEPEEYVAHRLRTDVPVGLTGDDGVFVLELVLQHLAHRRPERAVAVALPHVEVLPHPMDLDRLEHDTAAAPNSRHAMTMTPRRSRRPTSSRVTCGS